MGTVGQGDAGVGAGLAEPHGTGCPPRGEAQGQLDTQVWGSAEGRLPSGERARVPACASLHRGFLLSVREWGYVCELAPHGHIRAQR